VGRPGEVTSGDGGSERGDVRSGASDDIGGSGAVTGGGGDCCVGGGAGATGGSGGIVGSAAATDWLDDASGDGCGLGASGELLRIPGVGGSGLLGCSRLGRTVPLFLSDLGCADSFAVRDESSTGSGADDDNDGDALPSDRCRLPAPICVIACTSSGVVCNDTRARGDKIDNRGA